MQDRIEALLKKNATDVLKLLLDYSGSPCKFFLLRQPDV
jgi:hypothetical protein